MLVCGLLAACGSGEPDPGPSAPDPVDPPPSSWLPVASERGPAMAVGDFNHDGHLDVAVGTPSRLELHLNDGAARLTRPAKLPVLEGGASALASADVDGDGRVDLVVAHPLGDGRGRVSVLLAAGKDHFRVGGEVEVGADPRRVVLADCNNDGRLDALVITEAGVNVLLGRGLDGFAPPLVVEMGTRPTDIAVGDLNGDGVADLVVASPGYRNYEARLSGSLGIRLGLGDGTFAERSDQVLMRHPAALALADFDGDGRLDAITADTMDGTATLLRGNGDGTFTHAAEYAAGIAPSSPTVLDFNGDGALDVVMVNSVYVDELAPGLLLLLGDGAGSFGKPVPVPMRSFASRVAKGDFNEDGVDDVVLATPELGGVSLILGGPR